mmetsp:Transcript_1655/g.6507  ORF Transcript_1655/g.6507 Transcript_1655/m.6507 type:complete len:225 (-) Transcript_1655:42-716(-)
MTFSLPDTQRRHCGTSPRSRDRSWRRSRPWICRCPANPRRRRRPRRRPRRSKMSPGTREFENDKCVSHRGPRLRGALLWLVPRSRRHSGRSACILSGVSQKVVHRKWMSHRTTRVGECPDVLRCLAFASLTFGTPACGGLDCERARICRKRKDGRFQVVGLKQESCLMVLRRSYVYMHATGLRPKARYWFRSFMRCDTDDVTGPARAVESGTNGRYVRQTSGYL